MVAAVMPLFECRGDHGNQSMWRLHGVTHVISTTQTHNLEFVDLRDHAVVQRQQEKHQQLSHRDGLGVC